jgi:hypothetical protein
MIKIIPLVAFFMLQIAQADPTVPGTEAWESQTLVSGEPFAVVGSEKHVNTYVSVMFSPAVNCLPLVSYGQVVLGAKGEPSEFFDVELTLIVDTGEKYVVKASSQVGEMGQITSFPLRDEKLANEMINGKMLTLIADGVSDTFTLKNIAPSIVHANQVCNFLLMHNNPMENNKKYF